MLELRIRYDAKDRVVIIEEDYGKIAEFPRSDMSEFSTFMLDLLDAEDRCHDIRKAVRENEQDIPLEPVANT